MDERYENDEQLRNAWLAGWTPEIGAVPPYDHGTPPEDDPALGNNGIPPTDAAPLFEEVQ